MEVLERVAEGQAYAAPALDGALRRGRLDPRDAALATEVVYGALRALPTLDRRLGKLLDRGGRRLDGALRAALRAGAYQLLFLERVPDHAVVSDAVGWVRSRRGGRLAGVANAVLRKLIRQREEAATTGGGAGPAGGLELPGWVREAFDGGPDPAQAEARWQAFIAGRRMPPPVGIRVAARPAAGAPDPRQVDAVIEALRVDRPEAEVQRGDAAPGAVLLRHAGDPRRLPGWAEGRFAIQEEGAQRVAAAVEARPGESVLDACAGRGGKTAVLAQAVGPTGRLVAVDLHEGKLDRIPPELDRLGLAEIPLETRVVDLTVGTGGLPEGGFDRVLVDAPCTGLGTVHRRPEILLRVDEAAPGRLAGTQRAILARAARLVRPGGLLIYAVCSPSRQEGVGVVEGFRSGPAGMGFEVVGAGGDPDGVLRIGPWSARGDHGPDAYQVVRLRRRAD
jgi:16S rRNA (cytosine967-C5)-methyltransferase